MLQIKRSELKQLAQNKFGDDSIESQNKILVIISTSLAARTSYTVVGDEKEIDYQKMIELHDKLIELNHRSPLEHCARAMSEEEYISFRKGHHDAIFLHNGESGHWFIDEDTGELGWCRNFKGFIQYRAIIEEEK